MSNVRERGFTLMEFVVYTAIFAIIVVLLVQLIVSVVVSNTRGKAREAVINNAVAAVNAIDLEIRHAQAIYDPTSNFTSSPGQLGLVSIHDLPDDESIAFIDIYINSDQHLCIKKESTGNLCVTSDEVNVTALNFTKIDLAGDLPDGIQTKITVEYVTNDADQRVSFDLQSSSNVRAY